MNKLIDLSKLLFGLEGIKLYSPLVGDCFLSEIVIGEEYDDTYLIVSFRDDIDNHTYFVRFNRFGKFIGRIRPSEKHAKYYMDDEIFLTSNMCLLFPSKTKLNWDNYNPPLSVLDAPIMCHVYRGKGYQWEVRRYKEAIKGVPFVFPEGNTSKTWNGFTMLESFDMMIPCSLFDFKDIENSMKYNINKKK